MNNPITTPIRLTTFDELVHRALALTGDSRRGRHIIGITGAPGSGKTTLATTLIRAVNEASPRNSGDFAVHVPMDGFHLADIELVRLGRLDRKGAPDTFDAAGYAALLGRLREAAQTETVYAPAFDRDIEQPIAGAIPVPPQCRLVITEGNYLLLDEPPWHGVRHNLDEVWYCDADDVVRRRRLVNRHVTFGKTPAAAWAWVDEVDEPNARVIAGTRSRAQVSIAGSVALPTGARSTPPL